MTIALALNVLGFLRYPGGPLRDPSADGPIWLDIRPANEGAIEVGDVSGHWQLLDVPLQYGVLSLGNPSPFTATIDAITPIDATAGLVVDAVYVQRPDGVRGEVAAWGTTGVYPPPAVLATEFAMLPATVEPTGESHERDPVVILIVRSAQPGPIGWSALAVDYRLGPFSLRVIQHFSLTGCLGPMPAGMTCGDESVDNGEEEEGE